MFESSGAEAEVPRKRRRTAGSESEGEPIAADDAPEKKIPRLTLKIKQPVDPEKVAAASGAGDGGSTEKVIDSGAGTRRKEAGDNEPGKAQQEGEGGDGPEVMPGAGKVISEVPHVVQQKVVQPHESVAAALPQATGTSAGFSKPVVENISHGQHPQVGVPGSSHANQGPLTPSQVPAAGTSSANALAPSTTAASQAEPKAPALTQEAYRIPSHAGWFRWDAIHELEKRGVPEFFNGRSPSKTPKVYKEYRDFIITKFREAAGRELTFTEVRSMLVGDVNAIRRVFEFLEQWGLINFQVTTGTAKKGLPLSPWAGVPTSLVESAPGSLKIVAPAISPVASLYQFDRPKPPATSTRMSGGLLSAGLATHRNVFTSAAAAALSLNKGPAVEYHCNSCEADCSRRRYHNQKQADFDLCPKCYSDGKLGPGMTAADFIPMEAATTGGGTNTEEWTDQETLLLLEALELFGDNWQEIAEHVATKSKAQCILHFIQLPIEDPFLEELEQPSAAHAAMLEPPQETQPSLQGEAAKSAEEGGKVVGNNGAAGEGSETAAAAVAKAAAEAEGKKPSEDEMLTPFADAGNPVMAQVAFLAAMVGPRVAAAAAQAALAALIQEDPSAREAISAAVTAPTVSGNEPTANSEKGVVTEPVPGTPAAEGVEPGGVVKAEVGGSSEMEASAAMDVDRAEETERPEAEDADVGPPDGTTKETAAPPSDEPPSAVQVKAAAATALAAAAVKAKLLADQEEREIQRLVAEVIEAQLKKMEIKLRHFDELEELLEKERAQVERSRQNLYAERVRLAASRVAADQGPRNGAPLSVQAAVQRFAVAPAVQSQVSGARPGAGMQPGMRPTGGLGR